MVAFNVGRAIYRNLGTARRGYRAFTELVGKANGFVVDPIDDFVLVRDAGTPANNFCGTMAQALAAGILVYASPSTKYVRNSSGVLVPGTTLRCHYGSDGTPLGLRTEPQRTNLMLQSNTFSSGSWTKNSITATANAATGPDGAQSMWLMTGTAAVNRMWNTSSISITAGANYTTSFVVKRGNHDWLALYAASSSTLTNSARAWFNLNTGAVGNLTSAGSGWTAVRHTIEALGGGLYRIALTFASVSATSLTFSISPALSNGSLNKPNFGSGEGVGTEFYAGFAQTELGDATTSMIDTTTSAVTRNGDDISTALSKLPFSTSVGTVIEIGQPPQDFTTGGARFWTIDDGSSDNAIYTKAGTAGSKQRSASIIAATAEQLSVTPTTNDTAATYKAALAWASNDAQLVVNGATRGAADTSVTVPTGLTTLRYGRGAAGTDANYASAPLAMLVYLPERLSQAELIARTTL